MKKYIIIIILSIISLTVFTYFFQNFGNQKSDNFANIYIGSRTWQAEKAITDEQQMSGLMNRPSLDKDKGMIFMRSGDLIRNFWMKDTMIPLDLIFVDSGYNIVNIKTGIPYDLTPLSSNVPARYVIEINGGQTSEYNINIGDKVKID